MCTESYVSLSRKGKIWKWTLWSRGEARAHCKERAVPRKEKTELASWSKERRRVFGPSTSSYYSQSCVVGNGPRVG